jgi:hypothetical protein
MQARDASSDGADRLCTPTRDFCDGTNRIGSLDAFALVRAQVPTGRVTLVRSDPGGGLNVDGLDDAWSFVLADDTSHSAIDIGTAERTVSEAMQHTMADRCADGDEMQLLDSTDVVPDAVRRLEARLGEPFVGNLFMEQLGCMDRPEHHVTALLRERSEWYFARYLDDGRFLELVGPCEDNDVNGCLAGE